MKLRMKIRGDKELRARLMEYAKKYPEATAAALYQEGFGVMRVSQRKVPVDTGRLRATGYVAPPQEGRGGVYVELGYGTTYGIYVHERTELKHKVGEAKFLQKALQERSSGYFRRLAAKVKRNVTAGVGVSALRSPYPKSPEEGEKKFEARQKRKGQKRGRKKKEG